MKKPLNELKMSTTIVFYSIQTRMIESIIKKNNMFYSTKLSDSMFASRRAATNVSQTRSKMDNNMKYGTHFIFVCLRFS